MSQKRQARSNYYQKSMVPGYHGTSSGPLSERVGCGGGNYSLYKYDEAAISIETWQIGLVVRMVYHQGVILAIIQSTYYITPALWRLSCLTHCSYMDPQMVSVPF